MIYLIIVIASFLIGFNLSVISGTLVFLEDDILTTNFQQQIVVGSLLLGSFIGLICIASFIDWFGRRNSLVIGYALFFAGFILFALSNSIDGLVVGRLLCGAAVGSSSVVAPMFLAEISQKDQRGGFVSLHQLMITFGILIGYLSNYIVDGALSWRAPYVLGASIAGMGLFAAVLSRRFHFTHEPKRERGKILVWGKDVQHSLFIGIVLAILQQVCGINAIIYYAPALLIQEGLASREVALFASVGIGLVNFIMTIFAIYFIDRLGRRPLMIYGCFGMILGLGLAIFGYEQVGILLYIASFATSLGPVVWVYLSEIFPEKFRGRLLMVATFFNMLANAVVAFITLDAINLIGVTGVFSVFCAFLVFSIYFTLRFLPETKGESLDQIERMFRK
jgi:MFS family permease